MSRARLLVLVMLALPGCLRELVIVDEGSGTESGGASGCMAGEVDCEGECATLASDPQHCGACGVVCLPGQRCIAGECESESSCGCDDLRELCVDGACECRPGLSACGDACVDLTSDPGHCGGCDKPCAGFCVDGECEQECEVPKTACGSACVDLSSSLLHCEECGEACEADEVCVLGQCRRYTFAGCTSCPCECGDDQDSCCESSSLDAVLCVHDEACPP